MKLKYSRFIDFLFLDFKIFSDFSFNDRMKAAFAITLFTVALLCFTHLTLFSDVAELPVSSRNLVIVYALFLIVNAGIMLPFLSRGFDKYANFIALVALTILFCAGVAIGLFLTEVMDMINVSEHNAIIYLAGIVAISVSLRLYALLIKKVSQQKSEIESEIRIAKRMQQKLVPDVDIQNRRFQVFGKTISANEIGGDFFDVIAGSEDRLIIAIGDVSGHNISAGLLMAITKGAFRTEIGNLTKMENLVKSINRTIYENSDNSMFVSFLCAIFDFRQNIVTIVNAGHVPLLKFNPATNEPPEEHLPIGIALGLAPEADFHSEKIAFTPGDSFCFYTDGMIEAMNSNKEEYSLERLKRSFGEKRHDMVKDIYSKIMDDIYQFTGSEKLTDDETLVVLKIL